MYHHVRLKQNKVTDDDEDAGDGDGDGVIAQDRLAARVLAGPPAS